MKKIKSTFDDTQPVNLITLPQTQVHHKIWITMNNTVLDKLQITSKLET